MQKVAILLKPNLLVARDEPLTAVPLSVYYCLFLRFLPRYNWSIINL